MGLLPIVKCIACLPPFVDYWPNHSAPSALMRVHATVNNMLAPVNKMSYVMQPTGMNCHLVWLWCDSVVTPAWLWCEYGVPLANDSGVTLALLWGDSGVALG